MVRDNPSFPWNWEKLSCNPNFTWQLIQVERDKPWFIPSISKNPNITWQIVKENPSFPWNWRRLSSILPPDISCIKENLDKDLCWLRWSMTARWEDIKDNPDLPWSRMHVSLNENVTWEIVQTNPQFKWEYRELTYNPNITWQIIEENRTLRWNETAFALNPNATAKRVIEEIQIGRNIFQWVDGNVFGQHPLIRRRLLTRKYYSRWKLNIKRRKWRRNIYRPVLDMLTLRIRDWHNHQQKKPAFPRD